MASVAFSHVTKAFGEVIAVDDLSLEIALNMDNIHLFDAKTEEGLL